MLVLSACTPTPRPPQQQRLIHIHAAVDPVIRQQANWREAVQSRVETACAIFNQSFKVRCDFAAAVEWKPRSKASSEEERRELTQSGAPADMVFAGFVSAPGNGGEPGFAVPFDPRFLVFESPTKNERDKAAGLAHELAHVFGAWHSSESRSVMHLPPSEDPDPTAAQVIALTREVDFQNLPVGLDHATIEQVAKLLEISNIEPNPLLQAYQSRGYELAAVGRLQDALEPLLRAETLGPNNVTLQDTIAKCYAAVSDYHEAANHFRKETKLNPQSAAAMNNLGFALLRSGDPEGALQVLQKAKQMAPGNGAPHANIGLALLTIPGRRNEGIAEIREALRLDPDDQTARAYLNGALAQAAKRH
jgi:tetratricopeptide (TPR) repeat protein